ncbi:MAG: hypothetical protein CVV28_02195 [Methanobacteriales archaeon HGW-Methanobacteriales-1]|jgi:phage-related protein|nr:MAG: hypothetical protein CVV28_02195 [Methanobacteriales archaeon HGW-Methanobacteriales-1]
MASNSRRIDGFLTLDITDFTRKMSMVDTHLSSSSKNFGGFSTSLVETTTQSGRAGNAVSDVGKKAGSTTAELGRTGQAGTKMGQDVSKGATVGSKSLSSMSTNARGVTDSMDGISMAMGGIVAGFGAMTLVSASWTGSTQAQFNNAYLATKMSDSAAKGYISSIQKIVAVTPGDDTFLNQILTGAVARQTNLTTTQLQSLATGVADYTTVSQAMGKSQIETQMDLKEYVQTGNTSQLERDSILKNQIGTLEGQKTVSDRILAINKALKDEGYAGLSTLDIASIKWEELVGRVQMVATALGTSVLPTVQYIIEGIIDLDTSTGGWLIGVGLVTVGVIAIGAAFGMVSMAMAPVIGLMAPMALGIINMILPMVGLEVTAISASGGFMMLAGAVWSAMLPLLPFIALGVALGAVFYFVGQRFGWWTDLGSMAGVIWTGLTGIFQTLWSTLSGFIGWVSGVAVNVWNALTSSFYGSDGKFLGLVQGFQNLGGMIWNAIQPGLYALPGQLWGFFTSLPGIITSVLTAQSNANASIAGAIVGWFTSVDWMGVLESGLTFLASINPITLITRLLFGDAAADAAISFAVGSIMGFITSVGGFLSGLYSAVAPVAGGIVSALQPIICIILGCSPGIVPALQSLYSWFTSIFGSIWSFLGPIAGMITNGLRGIWGALSQGDFLGAFVAGFSALSNIGSYVLNFLMGVDWSGILMSAFTAIAGFAAQYNPVAMIASLIFGPSAGAGISAFIFTTLMSIGTTFVTGLQVIWTGLSTMVAYVGMIWNGLILGTQLAWGLLQIYILNPARVIWTTLNIIWSSIFAIVNSVWTRLHSGAINTFNAIKNAILSPFNTVKSILNSVWNGLKNGWNTLVNTMGSGASRLKSLVLSPIRTVYNGLVDLWNLVTGSKVPKMAGSAGPSKGSAGSAGPRSAGGFAGPSPSKSNSSSSGGGIWAGFTDTVRSYVNQTANLNGLKGRFAGPSPSGSLGDGPNSKKCTPDEPCYAGWDGMSNWSDKIKSLLTSWPTKANIGGIKVTSGLMNAILNGGGSLAIFNAVASQLIGKTHYDYYYDGKFSDAEALKRGSFNCFDGAEILIHLAQRLGLSASMGHGNWGSDGHVWALIAGKVFDTTAFQHGYGWKSPKVTGYNGAGPRPRMSSGPSQVVEKHEYNFDMTGSVIYGIEDLEKKMEKTANRVFSKRNRPNRATGN